MCSGKRHKDRAGRVRGPFRANAILRAHRVRADLGRSLRRGHDRPAELDRMPAKCQIRAEAPAPGGALNRATLVICALARRQACVGGCAMLSNRQQVARLRHLAVPALGAYPLVAPELHLGKVGMEGRVDLRGAGIPPSECDLAGCDEVIEGAVRLPTTWVGSTSAARPCRQFGLMVSHWKGRLPAIAPRSRRLIDGQVNRDASPHNESPGSALRRRPQLAAGCWRRVLRVGARAGPARATARAVPAVLAEQDRPGPRGVRGL
jgi:hypothetical protein